MSLLIVLLSIVMVLNAALLVLLILIQLPKKEAGAGLAFGAGATDALFGAGSGNALTKMTKYAATLFLGLVLTLSVLSQRVANAGSKSLESKLRQSASTPAATPSPLEVPLPTNAGTVITTNKATGQRITITPIPNTNSTDAAPAINVAPAPSTAPPAAPATTPSPQPAEPPK